MTSTWGPRVPCRGPGAGTGRRLGAGRSGERDRGQVLLLERVGELGRDLAGGVGVRRGGRRGTAAAAGRDQRQHEQHRRPPHRLILPPEGPDEDLRAAAWPAGRPAGRRPRRAGLDRACGPPSGSPSTPRSRRWRARRARPRGRRATSRASSATRRRRAAQVPGLGDQLRRPFDAAAGSLGDLVATADRQAASIERLAAVDGLAGVPHPGDDRAALWLPRRVRFVRRARAAQRFIDAQADLDLFALRAMANQPMHVLAGISDDPVRAWRAGDRRVIDALAEVELREAGCRCPRSADARTALHEPVTPISRECGAGGDGAPDSDPQVGVLRVVVQEADREGAGRADLLAAAPDVVERRLGDRARQAPFAERGLGRRCG